MTVLDEPWDAAAIQADLSTIALGHPTRFFASIGSTNDEAKRIALAGAPHGTLLVADAQTAGRGRQNRRWIAPAGSALLLSLILRPPLPAAQTGRLTMICGLAAADAITEVAGVQPGLKWPNDLLFGDRKVAGILTEMATLGEKLDFVIVGIGINVNASPALSLPDQDARALQQDPSLTDLPAEATCIAEQVGRLISRLALLRRFLILLEARYAALLAGASPHAEWAGRLSILGRRVRLTFDHQTQEGIAIGVNADGAIIIEDAAGARRAILAGALAVL